MLLWTTDGLLTAGSYGARPRTAAARLLTNFLAAGDNADANGCSARLDTAGVGGSVRKQRVCAGSRRARLTLLGSREAA